MTAEPMTDLAERVALALSWRKVETGEWFDPDGTRWRFVTDLPKLDWSIVPVVVEAIRERGWFVSSLGELPDRRWRCRLKLGNKLASVAVAAEGETPVVALCEAFVAAVEAQG